MQQVYYDKRNLKYDCYLESVAMMGL